jgi:thiol-disulfide isomerase/thioredoxin
MSNLRRETVYAPELDAALAWLNVDRPISIQGLRGCVVVLDFWTYCCVNCMHVVPTLRELEARYADQPVVVIGVHSGKFHAERDPERIREAIGRYGVEHPVVVDDDFRIWSAYAIRSWPTLVVVSPEGTIAAVAPGEPNLATLEGFVRRELDRATEAGTLASVVPDLGFGAPVANEPLLYPGKARALPNGRVAISDSGHHRVLLCEGDGQVALCAGTGIRGWADGRADQAAFDDPQGCCWFEGSLYVADCRNHAIRRIDVEAGEVTTVAGTGELGRGEPEGRVPALTQALRSPWDLCAVDDAIYIAMAGSHQIWRYHPGEGTIEVYAGTGVEALLDGPVATSAWSQPSGLSERDGVLYVADSESSAIRAVDLANDDVRTLVGQGLFDFGDGDGDADSALLQHCLGVAAVEDGVLIADTYNGKIKRWTSAAEGAGTIETELDGLSEPGSVSVTKEGVWLIADTNSHRVLGVREGAISELVVRGAPKPQRGAISWRKTEPVPASSSRGWFTTQLELAQGAGLKSGEGRLMLTLRAPDGLGLAPDSRLHVDLEVSRRSDLLLLLKTPFTVDARGGPKQPLEIDVRITKLPGAVVEAEIVATLEYVLCPLRDKTACTPGHMKLRIPVRLLSEGGGRKLAFDVPLANLDD